MKIGLFDSGLGGLIILRAVTKLLPQYDFEFYGDTANLPYGDKTEEEILELTRSGILHLFRRDCLLIIIACNTASAETLRTLQDTILTGEYSDRRILGVIIPTVEEVIERGDKKVALLATKRTVESKKYDREFAKFIKHPELQTIAETRLVTLLENNQIDEAEVIIKSHIKDVIKNKCDSLILGCTHFSLLKDYARNLSGEEEIRIISQDEIIPEKIRKYLSRHPEIESRLSRNSTRSIYLTDPNSKYDAIIANILGGTFIAEN